MIHKESNAVSSSIKVCGMTTIAIHSSFVEIPVFLHNSKDVYLVLVSQQSMYLTVSRPKLTHCLQNLWLVAVFSGGVTFIPILSYEKSRVVSSAGCRLLRAVLIVFGVVAPWLFSVCEVLFSKSRAFNGCGARFGGSGLRISNFSAGLPFGSSACGLWWVRSLGNWFTRFWNSDWTFLRGFY